MPKDIYHNVPAEGIVGAMFGLSFPFGLFTTKNPVKPVKVKAKPKRNDYCPCRSGLKYKKCCGF